MKADLGNRHKVPPSYSRAGKGARSLTDVGMTSYKNFTLTLKLL